MPAGESVNVNLSAVWACRRSSESIQLILQLIRIVRECIEIFALDHHSAGVVVGAGIDAQTLIAYLNLLLFDRQLQLDVIDGHFATGHFDVRYCGRCKAGSSDNERIPARNHMIDHKSAVAAGKDGFHDTAFIREHNRSGGNQGSSGVSNGSVDVPVRCLGLRCGSICNGADKQQQAEFFKHGSRNASGYIREPYSGDIRTLHSAVLFSNAV